jgi:hypothetical protein
MARITGTLHADQYTFFLSYLTHFFLEWEMFPANFVEKIKTHILYSITFFLENRAVYEICGKKLYSQTDHRWKYKTAQAHCKPDNYGYRHTLRICNTYCFSTATMVTRTGLNVTLYVHCLSCLCFGRKTRRQHLSGLNVGKHSHNVICSTCCNA